MAGLKGKSGPPGNMNAFKHGLAAVQKRREESITTEHEESARQQILVSWQKGNAGMPYTPGRLVEGKDACLSRKGRSRGIRHAPDLFRPQYTLAPGHDRADAFVDEFLHALSFVSFGGV